MTRSPKHLAFVRTLPCAKCGTPGPNQAAHIRIGTDGGMGLKPSDRYTVPLCWSCHDRQHRIGEMTFWGVEPRGPLELAAALWSCSGDQAAGRRLALDWLLEEVEG